MNICLFFNKFSIELYIVKLHRVFLRIPVDWLAQLRLIITTNPTSCEKCPFLTICPSNAAITANTPAPGLDYYS